MVVASGRERNKYVLGEAWFIIPRRSVLFVLGLQGSSPDSQNLHQRNTGLI